MKHHNTQIQAIFYNNPDQYPPIVNSTRLMVQAGYHVSILCREHGQNWNVAYPAEAQVTRLDTRGGSSWREYLGFVWQVWRWADGRARVFIGHDAHGFLPAWLLARRYRRPLVYHCHDYADPTAALGLGGRLVQAFESCFARTADHVIVPDRERAAVIAHDLHLKHPPLVVANAPLNCPPGSGAMLKQALEERGRHFVQVLFRQGRVGVGHGLEMTIRSIPYWHRPDWGLVVMGLGERAYLEQLTELARVCGVSDRFVYLPPVGYDRVANFTLDAQLGHALYDPIHVNNKHITTASNKIMEYLAAGLPVLASDRPGLRKLIETYDCGITADESSPESIAHAVNTLLGDPDLAQRQGQNGRRAFEEVFCYERQFAPVLDVLEKLCSTR